MGKDASTIRHEIEMTREQMGDTVEALGFKADVPSRIKDSVQGRVDAAKDALGDMVDTVKTTVVGAGDATAQTRRDGADALSDAGGKIRAKANELNGRVSDRLQSVDVSGSAQRAVGVIQENPIGLSLAALAIGFLCGSLVPVSQIERERLSPLRTKIVDQAQAAASDLVEAGKAVIAETAQTAVASAKNSVQSHGQDVVDAAKARAAQS